MLLLLRAYSFEKEKATKNTVFSILIPQLLLPSLVSFFEILTPGRSGWAELESRSKNDYYCEYQG